MTSPVERAAFHLSSAAFGHPDGFATLDLGLLCAVTPQIREATPQRRSILELVRGRTKG